jgi:hypothetical protein
VASLAAFAAIKGGMMKVLFTTALVCSALIAPAFAQEAGAAVVVAPSPVMVAPPPSAPTATDGLRFRGGIAAAGGAEFASGFAVGMGGVEGRAGLQINNLIGVYLQPYLSFGGGSVSVGAGSLPAVTGTAGLSALIDFTFADRFFAGIGGGFGILNNPVGPEIHVRVGGYPIEVTGEDGYSRQGLMVGLDARLFILFSGPNTLPVMQMMASVGYEVF